MDPKSAVRKGTLADSGRILKSNRPRNPGFPPRVSPIRSTASLTLVFLAAYRDVPDEMALSGPCQYLDSHLATHFLPSSARAGRVVFTAFTTRPAPATLR
jgi:hypothetical protein